MTSEFERSIEFVPGYDRRHLDPNKNYGIHGVTIRWRVWKENSAVQFVVYTCWEPLNVQNERMHNHIGTHIGIQPMAADLGYHSPTPQWGNQTEDECDLLEGGKCFYDGSGLNAEPVRDRLLAEGGDAVWQELENYWHSLFGEAVKTL